MKRLNQITDFLIGLDLVAAENIDSWAENFKVQPINTYSVIYPAGFISCRMTYDAVIYIERFRHQSTPFELLLAQVSAWLANHGWRPDGENSTIVPDVDILDDQTADITLAIDFCEDIELVEWPGGPIELGDKRYQLRDLVINIAEDGEVTT